MSASAAITVLDFVLPLKGPRHKSEVITRIQPAISHCRENNQDANGAASGYSPEALAHLTPAVAEHSTLDSTTDAVQRRVCSTEKRRQLVRCSDDLTLHRICRCILTQELLIRLAS